MKYLQLVIYIFLAPSIIALYSILTDIEISGNSFAIVGYKLLWIATGVGFYLFYKWIINDEN